MSYISANSAIRHLYFYRRHVNVLKPSCVVYDLHWCTKFIVAGYHWIQWRYRFRVTMSTHSLAFLSASLELLRSLTFYPLWVTTGHSESFYLSLTPEVWSEAPETRPLPAISRAHPPASLTDCPTGAGRFPWPVFQGQISYCTSSVTLPSVAPPPAVLRRFGRATVHYVDRSMGSRPAMPPFASLPAIQLRSRRKRYVLGQSRESQSRPGNAFSRELTSPVPLLLYLVTHFACFSVSVPGQSPGSKCRDAAGSLSAVSGQTWGGYSENCTGDAGRSSESNHGQHDCWGEIYAIMIPFCAAWNSSISAHIPRGPSEKAGDHRKQPNPALPAYFMFKSRLVLTFLVPDYPDCPGKEAVKQV